MPPRFHHPALADFFLSDTPASPPVCALAPDEAHHATRVLRLGPGDAVELFDGRGHNAAAVITETDRHTVQCRLHTGSHTPAPAPRITVATALPKGSRAEDLVNQLTQLAADVVVPLICERGVVEAKARKIERLEKSALAAAKQCGRAHGLAIAPPLPFAAALQQAAAADLARLLAPGTHPWPAGQAQTQLAAASHIWVLVGPEGGWSDHEHAAAQASGLARWSLNPNVLRIEAAAAAAVATLRYLAPEPPAAAQSLSFNP